MKYISIAAAVAISVAAGNAFATPYQLELNASYLDADEVDAIGISAQWYFSQVQTGSHPLAEAAFLERESSLAVAWIRTDTHIYPVLAFPSPKSSQRGRKKKSVPFSEVSVLLVTMNRRLPIRHSRAKQIKSDQ